MKLTFTQMSLDVGSVIGDGIYWHWSGYHLEGPEKTIDKLGETIQAKLKEEWPGINEDYTDDIPVVAEVRWPRAKVLSLELNFVFDEGAIRGPEETKNEIQVYFSEPVEFADTLVRGKNVAKVGEKTFDFHIDSPK